MPRRKKNNQIATENKAPVPEEETKQQGITPEEAELILQFLRAARAKAVLKFPYLAHALTTIRIVPRPTYGTPTVGVDKHWRLYWNPNYVRSFMRGTDIQDWDLSPMASVWVHEVWHLLREHFRRAGDRHPLKWNIATDLEINDDMEGLPDGALYPSSFGFPEQKSAEEYYDMLPDQASCELYGCEGEGSGVTGRQASWELSENSAECEGASQSEIVRVRQETARQIKEASRQAGNIPAGWERWADEVLNPQVDWRKELRSVITQEISKIRRGLSDFSYMMPSRRRLDSEFIYPAMVEGEPNVTVIIDTSGSMDERDLSMCLAEVKGILTAISGKVTVVCADTEVHSVQTVFSPKEIVLKGGGGTDMGEAISWVAERLRETNICVVLTDGETPWDVRVLPKFKVIVVLVQEPRWASPPPEWAKVIRIGDRGDG